jgi:hypothetical protein
MNPVSAFIGSLPLEGLYVFVALICLYRIAKVTLIGWDILSLGGSSTCIAVAVFVVTK